MGDHWRHRMQAVRERSRNALRSGEAKRALPIKSTRIEPLPERWRGHAWVLFSVATGQRFRRRVSDSGWIESLNE